ncbi:MAG: hypothetical protein M8357_16275 [Desulfobulbaceae bacterium]|nr:hypothetical protein [Desulfobulbaceae bacterium]
MHIFYSRLVLMILIFLLASPCWAQNKVVVIPMGSSIKPGTVVEGTLNGPILTVTNNENSSTLGSAFTAHGSSPTAPAIAGYHHSTGHGLYGYSNSVYPSVGGRNDGSGEGVHGYSAAGNGIFGYAASTSDGIGVVGIQAGYSVSDFTSYFKPGGFFGGRNGVIGVTKADSGYAVFGWDQSPSGGWAARFHSDNGSGVYVSVPAGKTGLNVANGTKNAVVATDDGARLMYSEESTEVWFTDYGFAQLQNDLAVVTFDPIFTQTVNLSMPYHVFLQPYGNANLYVTNRTPTGFEVHLQSGDANIEFSYRIVARRQGLETARIERAPWADNDPNLYPGKAGFETELTQGVQESN